MSAAKTHLRNLLANWTAHAASLVVMFFLSPFVLHSLGQVAYGIWSLLTVLTGYLGFADLGIKASTGRHIILYLGKGDFKGVDETIETSLGFFSCLGGVVLLAGLAVAWAFPYLFPKAPGEYRTTVFLLIPIMAVNIWLAAIQAVFSSVLIAYERFDLTRSVDLVALGVQAGGTVLSLCQGAGLCGLALAILASHMVSLVGNYLLARRVYANLRIWPWSLRRKRLRELMGYGAAAFVSAVSFRLIGQTDLVVVGASLDMASVAVYSVGAMLVYYAGTFLGHINTVLFPAIQKAVAKGERGSAKWLLQRANRLGILAGVLVYVGLIAFAEPFIRLWMGGPKFGDDSVHKAATVMMILAGSKLPLLFVGASVPLLNAIGRVKLTAGLAATEAALNLGLSISFVLVMKWGLAGVALGTLAARILVGTFVAPWRACVEIGANPKDYLWRNGGPILLSGGLWAAWCVGVRSCLPSGSWLQFGGQLAAAVAGYACLAWFLLLPEDDRARLWRTVARRPVRLSGPAGPLGDRQA